MKKPGIHRAFFIVYPIPPTQFICQMMKFRKPAKLTQAR